MKHGSGLDGAKPGLVECDVWGAFVSEPFVGNELVEVDIRFAS